MGTGHESARRTVTRNLAWRFAERCGAQGVSFVVSVVLARLLAPELYATIALITVFTSILNVFIDSGFGNALIQKKDADDLDFSTVFWFNLSVCALLYLLMYLCAPLIADFYRDPTLTPLVRVLSLTLIISGVKNIQQAYVSRTMQFRRFFFATLGGTVGAAVIGIWMAYRGYGVWALVAQQLFNAAVDTVILWVTVRWRPKKMFSFERLKRLFAYGWKLLVSALLDTVNNEIRQLVIGRRYSGSDLAFYNKGKHLPDLFVKNINSSIDSVLFPTMSKAQDSTEHVKAMVRRAMKTSTYIMAPLMLGLAAVGTPLIRLLLTEKWLPCVPFMRIFCVTLMFYPLHTSNLNAIKAMGRSDLFLKLEVIKKTVSMIVLIISMQFGVMAIAYSLLLTSFTSQLINSWPNRKLLGYSWPEQMKDILPGILLAAGMAVSVYLVQLLGLSDLLTLCIQIPLGAAIYLGASWILKLEAFRYLTDMIRQFVAGRRKAKQTTADDHQG